MVPNWTITSAFREPGEMAMKTSHVHPIMDVSGPATGNLTTSLRLVIGAVGILAIYVPIFPRLIKEWAAFPNLSHGFAIPLIAGYLMWIRRGEIVRTVATPSWLGLPLVAVGLGLHTAGSLGNEPFLVRISLPVTLLGGVVLVSGWRIAGKLAPGIAYLLFMIPPPYVVLKEVTDRVRLFDATVTAMALPYFGVPVLQEGYLLHLPNITLEVAEECSSIPAMAALLALAVALGYVNRRSGRIQVVLILSAMPIGILSNIIRIISTAIGTYFLGRIALDNVIHMWNGTTVFLMTLGLLLALDAMLLRLWPQSPAGSLQRAAFSGQPEIGGL
jgi:exosortase